MNRTPGWVIYPAFVGILLAFSSIIYSVVTGPLAGFFGKTNRTQDVQTFAACLERESPSWIVTELGVRENEDFIRLAIYHRPTPDSYGDRIFESLYICLPYWSAGAAVTFVEFTPFVAIDDRDNLHLAAYVNFQIFLNRRTLKRSARFGNGLLDYLALRALANREYESGLIQRTRHGRPMPSGVSINNPSRFSVIYLPNRENLYGLDRAISLHMEALYASR